MADVIGSWPAVHYVYILVLFLVAHSIFGSVFFPAGKQKAAAPSQPKVSHPQSMVAGLII